MSKLLLNNPETIEGLEPLIVNGNLLKHLPRDIRGMSADEMAEALPTRKNVTNRVTLGPAKEKTKGLFHCGEGVWSRSGEQSHMG